MAILKSNRINDMSPGSTIDDAFRDLEASLSEIMGVDLDVEYNSPQVAHISTGVTGGNQHNHDGVNTVKLRHGTISDPGALLEVGQYSHQQIDAHINGTAYQHTGHELVANKGQPNGYCPLDANAKIPQQHLPQLSFFKDCAYTFVQSIQLNSQSSIVVPFSMFQVGTGYSISNNSIVCPVGIHGYFIVLFCDSNIPFVISIDEYLGSFGQKYYLESVQIPNGYILNKGISSIFQKKADNPNNLQIVLTNLSIANININRIDFTIFRITGITI